jgi:hypothetical protein
MWPRVLRKGIPALITLTLMSALLPDPARAGRFFAGAGLRGGVGPYRPGYVPLAVGVGVGLGYGYYGYPLDDSFDYPYGYGEYAEYGPWAYRGNGSGVCQLAQRRVRTAYGLRWRTVRICN